MGRKTYKNCNVPMKTPRIERKTTKKCPNTGNKYYSLRSPPPPTCPPPFWSLFSYRTTENTSKMQMTKKWFNSVWGDTPFRRIFVWQSAPLRPLSASRGVNICVSEKTVNLTKNNTNTAKLYRILLRLWVLPFSSHPILESMVNIKVVPSRYRLKCK